MLSLAFVHLSQWRSGTRGSFTRNRSRVRPPLETHFFWMQGFQEEAAALTIEYERVLALIASDYIHVINRTRSLQLIDELHRHGISDELYSCISFNNWVRLPTTYYDFLSDYHYSSILMRFTKYVHNQTEYAQLGYFIAKMRHLDNFNFKDDENDCWTRSLRKVSTRDWSNIVTLQRIRVEVLLNVIPTDLIGVIWKYLS